MALSVASKHRLAPKKSPKKSPKHQEVQTPAAEQIQSSKMNTPTTTNNLVNTAFDRKALTCSLQRAARLQRSFGRRTNVVHSRKKI